MTSKCKHCEFEEETGRVIIHDCEKFQAEDDCEWCNGPCKYHLRHPKQQKGCGKMTAINDFQFAPCGQDWELCPECSNQSPPTSLTNKGDMPDVVNNFSASGTQSPSTELARRTTPEDNSKPKGKPSGTQTLSDKIAGCEETGDGYYEPEDVKTAVKKLKEADIIGRKMLLEVIDKIFGDKLT